jgi:uncharacterized protein YjgD (DUF1641 family)
MPVISFKCQNCGANLDFQGEKQVSVCKSCGVGSSYEREGDDFTFYMVDVEVTNNNFIENATFVTGGGSAANVENLLTLMRQAHHANNYEDCYAYASRVLEEDPKNGMAWFYKGLAAGYTSSLASFRTKEVMTCYRNALNNSTGKEKNSIRGMSSLLIDLARGFVGQSREHSLQYRGVESSHEDHMKDIRQACNMLLEIYKLTESKGALKAIVEMTDVYDEFKSTRNETLKLLEGIDPKFVQAKKDEKSFDNMSTCGCGVFLLVVIGGALYFILK